MAVFKRTVLPVIRFSPMAAGDPALWKGHELDHKSLGVPVGPIGMGFPPFVYKDAEAGSETSCCSMVVFIKTISVIVI
jgi:hypothetical protein